MRESKEALIGDTICHTSSCTDVEPLPGMKPAKQMVSNTLSLTICVCVLIIRVEAAIMGTVVLWVTACNIIAIIFKSINFNCLITSTSTLYLQVFAGIYPFNQSEYHTLRIAIEKLILNDNSVSSQRDISMALGQGWRLGFLGLLHMDVFIQRLEEVKEEEREGATQNDYYLQFLRNLMHQYW